MAAAAAAFKPINEGGIIMSIWQKKTCRCYLAGTIAILMVSLILTGCGLRISSKTDQTSKSSEKTGQTTTQPANPGGLDSIAAAALAYEKAAKVFDDAVLWRMIPTNDGDSTQMLLDTSWQGNDRSAAWFIWYADAAGENWMMYTIKGKKITGTDIGTRDFTAMSMPAEWPRQKLPVSMKDAAAAAAGQGANLDNLSWLEYSCKGLENRAAWIFSCYDVTKSGSTLNYKIYVDAVTGEVLAARNDRNDGMALPIDLDKLEETRATDHQADVLKFFSFITKKDPIWSVRQLSYKLCPNEAAGQAWLANFQSLDTLDVVKVEPVRLAEWTDEWEIYKVTLKVTTAAKPDQYGWENGTNIRWITIIPQGAGAWKVEEIATNP
jgi:hypothetical protein